MISMVLKNGLIYFWVLGLIVFTTCANPYATFSDQSSNAAIYEDAIKAMNASQWSLAISKFETLSPDYLAQRTVRFNYAKTLAGRCGYDFIGFAASFSDANVGGNTFMQFLLGMWGNKVVSPAFCSLSEAQMRLLWQNTTPTADEQFFMAFMSLAKMGMYLRSKADVGENGGLGDGVTDVGFDSCDATDSLTTLTNDEIREVLTGLGNFLVNLVAVGDAISSNVNNTVTTVNTLCGVVNPNPCTQTEASAISDDMVTSMRNLLSFVGFGLTTSCGLLPCCP